MPVWIWIIVVLGGVLAVWGVAGYNRLVGMRMHCVRAFGDIDVQLRLRHDLVANLVETVKGYAAHERGTLEAVVEARNAAAAAKAPADRAAAENILFGALRRVFALAEAYPDLEANSSFLQLQASLARIETDLAAARRRFNDAVRQQNTMLQQMPAVLFAKSLGFSPHEFFQAGEEREQVGQPPRLRF